MSLDFYIVRHSRGDFVESKEPPFFEEVFWYNITHNLTRMAEEAGLYKCLWRPEENYPAKELECQDDDGCRYTPVCVAVSDIIDDIRRGYIELESKPEYYQRFDSSNGWGLYKNFLPWVGDVLRACEENMDGYVYVSR